MKLLVSCAHFISNNDWTRFHFFDLSSPLFFTLLSFQTNFTAIAIESTFSFFSFFLLAKTIASC